MSRVPTIEEKDEEILQLKKIIHTAHFALLTCKHYAVGQTTLQKYNAEKVRRAIVLTEDVAVNKTLDDIESVLLKQKKKTQPLTNSIH